MVCLTVCMCHAKCMQFGGDLNRQPLACLHIRRISNHDLPCAAWLLAGSIHCMAMSLTAAARDCGCVCVCVCAQRPAAGLAGQRPGEPRRSAVQLPQAWMLQLPTSPTCSPCRWPHLPGHTPGTCHTKGCWALGCIIASCVVITRPADSCAEIAAANDSTVVSPA